MTAGTASEPIADRRRAFVAKEIEDAAIRVFAERGYDNVTVADIAEAAGVSRRTFFRYFTSKDHVLWAQSQRLQVRVVAALERRPAGELAVDALCNAFLDTAMYEPNEQLSVLTRNRVLREAHERGGMVLRPAVSDTLVSLIAERIGVDPDTDPRPRIIVHTVWAVVEVAADHWALTATTEPLKDSLARAFDILRTGLDVVDKPPRRRPTSS